MDVKSLFDMAVSGAVQGFVENGEVPQVALAIAEGEQLFVIPCPWNGEEERGTILHALRCLFKIRRVRYYAFVSEAWFGTYDGKGPLVMPSKSEQRKEVVFIVATDGTEQHAGFMEIIRPFDGPATLDEFELFSDGQSGGDLLTLLS